MELLDQIDIIGREGKRIELYQGDLTTLLPDEAIDLLIVSAFPNDYLPTDKALIGALYRKGLSVAELSQHKASDLRHDFSCWLSHEIRSQNPELHIKRILCFEPMVRGEPPEFVGDIFRALAPILYEVPDIASIAMPIVSTGDMGYSTSAMLIPLLEASIQWMEKGLPLDCIKIVAHSEEQRREAEKIFSQKKTQYQQLEPPSQPQIEYDVFISYARENGNEVEVFEKELSRSYPNIRIFLDRKSIDIGSSWQLQIFESLERCRKVVVFLSSDYLNSKMCKEEYNIARSICLDTEQEILFPLYLYSANLPAYMKSRNYLDCREGDETKLQEASNKLLSVLGLSG